MTAKFYKDVDLSFDLDPNTGDIKSLDDSEAVKNSIINLVMTQKGEALFNINKGSNIRKLLFSVSN